MLRVPKRWLDMQKIQNDLYIRDLAREQNLTFGFKSDAPEGVHLWEEDLDYVWLPRGYDFFPALQTKLTIDDWSAIGKARRSEATGKPWTFRGELRENQIEAARALFDCWGQDKTLCLGCGKGKTILALWYASQRGVRTLVIVDRSFILKQWKKAIGTFLLPVPGDVGHVQEDICRVGNKITIAMVHTLSQRDFPQEFYDQFDLIIFDEVHVAAAPTFRVLNRFVGERLGLSATLERKDGLHPVYMLHLGGMQPCHVDLDRDQPAEWNIKRLPRCVPMHDEQRCYRRLPGMRRNNGQPVYALMRPRFESLAARSDEWFEIVMQDIRRAVETNRDVLLLGSQKAHLVRLYEACLAEGIDAGLATSAVSEKRREDAFERQVLLATWQLAGKALDIPRLNTLIFLYPNKDEGFLRQAVGRIDRMAHTGIKPLVLVYSHFYVDSLMRTEAELRLVIKRIDPRSTIRTINANHSAN